MAKRCCGGESVTYWGQALPLSVQAHTISTLKVVFARDLEFIYNDSSTYYSAGQVYDVPSDLVAALAKKDPTILTIRRG